MRRQRSAVAGRVVRALASRVFAETAFPDDGMLASDSQPRLRRCHHFLGGVNGANTAAKVSYSMGES